MCETPLRPIVCVRESSCKKKKKSSSFNTPNADVKMQKLCIQFLPLDVTLSLVTRLRYVTLRQFYGHS